MHRALRATKIQAAFVAVLVGVMMVLLGGGGVHRRPEPSAVRSVRPATEQERQQYELEREMDRMWPEWGPAPSAR